MGSKEIIPLSGKNSRMLEATPKSYSSLHDPAIRQVDV